MPPNSAVLERERQAEVRIEAERPLSMHMPEPLDGIFPLSPVQEVVFGALHHKMFDLMKWGIDEGWCPTGLYNEVVEELGLTETLKPF